MKHLGWYALGGLGVAVTAAALIKRKPKYRRDDTMLIGPGKRLSGPKVYLSTQGDNPSSIAARFGIKPQSFKVVGNKYYLPSGVADMGPRTGAQGVVR